MKINTEWLREYVDLPESPARLKEELTMFGLVVEAVADFHGTPVLEIEVTSNRPDCLSHLGVAREIAAMYQRKVRAPAIKSRLRLRKERIPYRIEIQDPDLCPRYVGLLLDNIRVSSSPIWMQERLESAGMRPVNNVVDITNYVLLEMGHPLHAFDFDLLRGGMISVARAQEGQKITTLDGIERSLNSDMLLICDSLGPVAIAGVMGGSNSEISLTTSRVLLECAYFEPSSVRRTARRLALATEASYRFERGVDPEDLISVVGRTCDLMREFAGARVAGSLKDVYPRRVEPIEISLHRKHAEALLGVELTDGFIEESLKKLNFRLMRRGRSVWQARCPSYRADMEMEADIIEELARFHGYQNIPTTVPAGKTAGVPSPASELESAVRRVLSGLGYSEGVNLSFAGESENQEFPWPGRDRIAVRNPLTEDTRYLRTTLTPGLIRSARHNFNHGQYRVMLYEMGKVYQRGHDDRPVERRSLGIIGTGDFTAQNWLHLAGQYDFYHLKGVVEALLRALRSAPFELSPAGDIAWLNPSNSARIFIGEACLGMLGSLHSALAEKYKFKQPILLAEIDLDGLSQHLDRGVRYVPLPKFPLVERDLSLVIDRDVPYGEIRKGLFELGISELRSIELVDVYEGEKIPEGKISLTLRCAFLDPEKTLTVDRVQGFSDNIVNFLFGAYGAELR